MELIGLGHINPEMEELHPIHGYVNGEHDDEPMGCWAMSFIPIEDTEFFGGMICPFSANFGPCSDMKTL